LISDPRDKETSLLRGLTLVTGAGVWSLGILLGSLDLFPPLAALGAVGWMLLLTILLWHRRQGRLLALLGLVLCLGMWRYEMAAPENDPQALLFFADSTPVRIQGTVVEMPRSSGQTRTLIVEATRIQRDKTNRWEDVHGRLEVQTARLGATLEDIYGINYGAFLELHGKLQPPSAHRPRTILANMTFPAITMKGDAGSPLIALLYHFRVRLAEIIEQALPQPAAAVLTGIVLGLNTEGLQPLSPAFKTTSTTHLLVTSGSNITLLAALVTASTRWLSRSRPDLLPAEKRWNWRSLLVTMLTIVCISAYTVLSGAGIPAIRAGLMGVLVAIAPRLGRRYHVYTALALTLILLSVLDPLVLWDISFQLSYLSMVGILLITPFLTRAFRLLERLPAGSVITENVAVTLAAQIAMLPIFAVDFQQVSLIAPFANILAIPSVELLLPLGLFLCLCGLLFAPLALLCGWVAWPLLWYLITTVTWCAQVPGASIHVEGLDNSIIWGYYGILALILYGLIRVNPRWLSTDHKQDTPSGGFSLQLWRRIYSGAALLILVITGSHALFFHPPNDITITFLSVGPPHSSPQGQAILIRTSEKTVLIDGGPDTISLAQTLDHRLPSWQRSLDLVLLTCPRNEHLGGLQDIVERYTIGMVIDGGTLHPGTTYTRWRRTIRERNLQYTAVSKGATISLGDMATLQVLWPTTRLHKGNNEARDNGLIVQLVAPGLRVLLLGAGAQSAYALAGLLAQHSAQTLHSDIVQMIGETAKPVLDELTGVLRKANPTMLVVTPTTQRKTGPEPTSTTTMYMGINLPQEHIISTAQNGTIEIASNAQSWRLYRTDDA
jgi:competence protein ComEC